MPPSSSLPLKQITVILKIVSVVHFLHINLYKPIRSFQSILSSSKLLVPYQSLYLLNLVVRTIFITFIGSNFIFLSSGYKFQRGYCVIFICLQGLSATTLFASKHDHRMSRSIRFVTPGARANQITISSFCPLFHFSARYFTFLPAVSIRTTKKLTNQI